MCNQTLMWLKEVNSDPFYALLLETDQQKMAVFLHFFVLPLYSTIVEDRDPLFKKFVHWTTRSEKNSEQLNVRTPKIVN